LLLLALVRGHLADCTFSMLEYNRCDKERH
jgi:hypothetical protein